MRLMVVSDSHHNYSNLEFAVKECKPDAVAHLGDCYYDAIELQQIIPDLLIYKIRGNCDPASYGDEEMLLNIEGVRILLTHGHRHYVKENLALLTSRARQQGVNLVLFGHTHNGVIVNAQDIVLMNPGQLLVHTEDRLASYGVVTIEYGKFDCGIIYLPNRAR